MSDEKTKYKQMVENREAYLFALEQSRKDLKEQLKILGEQIRIERYGIKLSKKQLKIEA